MADLAGRNKFERLLLRALADVNGESFSMIMELLGDPPDAAKLTPELWQGLTTRYSGATLTSMEQVFMTAAEGLASEISLGFDWTLINERAASWAASQAGQTARDIVKLTDRRLGGILRDYFETQMNLDQLADRITPLFGRQRAEEIAITEITRASSEGERQYADALLTQGVRLIPTWNTNNDDRVCPICGPKHGERITGGDYPPAHPRCRCFVTHQVEVPNGG